jgi:two-component system, chemotaxis family, sensor kinase CheA
MDLKNEFMQEALEHLATAEDDVLFLEQASDASGVEKVNRLFRALHTIKGGAACINFTGIKDLSHALESVVGLVRDGTLSATVELIQLMLDGLDKLKAGVCSGEDIDNESDIISRCKAITLPITEKTEGDRKAAAGKKRVFDMSNYDLSIVHERLLHVHEITINMETECKKAACTSLELIEKLKSIGTIIATTHNQKMLEKETSGPAPVSFLLATLIDDPQIIFLGLDLSPLSHFTYDYNEIPLPVQTHFPVAAASSEKGLAKTAVKSAHEQIVRVSVEIVDKLMNLAGELVVVRNRNSQVLADGNAQELSAVNQRLDVVTSEIQATVMRTRMCPVGEVFGRFTRVVRDLNKQLGKEIELDISGAEVELDKSIIDGLFEPLSHLVRNAADHGIESPMRREEAGKPPVGQIRLTASHQTGQVNIQVIDNGKGIDPHVMREAAIKKGLLTPGQAGAMRDRELVDLIFLPGFSTSEKVTDISGRGVGMDAVKSSLQKLGGIVEIQSSVGKGTVITVRLPLTLAILPALISTVENQRFAIPQVNVVEVVWLYGDEVYQSVRMIDGKEIYWLREKMLPLLRLSKVLKIKRSYRDPLTGESKPERRIEAPDRRQMGDSVRNEKRRGARDRRTSIENSLYIIVLRIGGDRFGLCVDRIVDTEEIVVKPLHDRLRTCPVYAGVTVLGDGVTALILDVPELARTGGVRFETIEAPMVKARTSVDERQKMLLFTIGKNEHFAIPLSLLMRVDEIHAGEIKTGGGREYILFRNSVIPLVRIERAISGITADYGTQYVYAIIPKIGRPIGIAAAEIIDIVEIDGIVESASIDTKAIIGTQLIGGQVTSILDICALIETQEPGWFAPESRNGKTMKKVVMAEDSAFFCALIGSYLHSIGIDVLVAKNGKEALELLSRNVASIDAVLSDIEMPVLDGFDLARQMKSTKALAGIPLLGISATEDASIRFRALDAGFDEFMTKSDIPSIAEALNGLMKRKRS